MDTCTLITPECTHILTLELSLEVAWLWTTFPLLIALPGSPSPAAGANASGPPPASGPPAEFPVELHAQSGCRNRLRYTRDHVYHTSLGGKGRKGS